MLPSAFFNCAVNNQRPSIESGVFSGNGQKQFDEFSRSFSLPAFETDLKGNIIYANPDFSQLLGSTTGAPGNYFSIVNFIHDDNKELFNKIFFDTISYETNNSTCFSCLTAGKETISLLINMAPVSNEGKVSGIRGIILPSGSIPVNDNASASNSLNHSSNLIGSKNINKGRELTSNTKPAGFNWMKSIYDHSSFGIFMISAGMRLEMINPALLNMLGFKNEKSLYENPSILKQFLTKTKHGFSKPAHKMTEFEISLTRNDGRFISIKIHFVHHFDPENDSHYYIGIAEDITKRKQTGIYLLNAIKKNDAAEVAKTSFLNLISHEIRTPLHSLVGFTELLKDELETIMPNELKSVFEFMKLSGKRLTRTIDLLLLMSDLQTKVFEQSPSKFELEKDILTELYNNFKPAATNKKIIFTFNLGGANVSIFNDKFSVKQILFNIVENAVKFTEKGYITLDVSSDNEEVIIKVEDTGVGISEKYMKTIFTPFSQEETGYSRRYEGNGLGLAVAKHLADINEISIEVESRKTKGTVFLVRIKRN